MPRIVAIVAVLVGACTFDADYSRGHYSCSDGKCPAGLVCANATCIAPPLDAADGNGPDAPQAALTCGDAGPFPASGGTTSGTTAARTSTVSASCNGSVMNGADAVYRIDLAAGAQLTITVGSGAFPVAGYAIAPCVVTPATPACIGDTYATAGSPVDVTAATAGTYFVIVDGTAAALSGAYTLTLAVH
jgi:hypothetical protein